MRAQVISSVEQTVIALPLTPLFDGSVTLHEQDAFEDRIKLPLIDVNPIPARIGSVECRT